MPRVRSFDLPTWRALGSHQRGYGSETLRPEVGSRRDLVRQGKFESKQISCKELRATLAILAITQTNGQIS